MPLESIFIVHTDADIRNNLRVGLQDIFELDYAFSTFKTTEAALRALRTHRPAFLIMQAIPHNDKFDLEVIHDTYARHSVPYMMMGPKDETIEARALDFGADDYVYENRTPRLIAERMRAILRRYRNTMPGGSFTQAANAHKRFLHQGLMHLDFEKRQCTWKGKPVALTATEFNLVWALAEKTGHVKTRDMLLAIIASDNMELTDRSVDAHIKRLRVKFKAIDPQFDAIVTYHHVGYALNPRPKSADLRPRPQV